MHLNAFPMQVYPAYARKRRMPHVEFQKGQQSDTLYTRPMKPKKKLLSIIYADNAFV